MTIPLILKIFGLIGLCAALESLKHKREELVASEHDAAERKKAAKDQSFQWLPSNTPERQEFVKKKTARWAKILRKAQIAAVGFFAADFLYFSIDISRYAAYIKHGSPFEGAALCVAESIIIIGHFLLFLGVFLLMKISCNAFAESPKEIKDSCLIFTILSMAIGLLCVQEIGPFIIEYFAEKRS